MRIRTAVTVLIVIGGVAVGSSPRVTEIEGIESVWRQRMQEARAVYDAKVKKITEEAIVRARGVLRRSKDKGEQVEALKFLVMVNPEDKESWRQLAELGVKEVEGLEGSDKGFLGLWHVGFPRFKSGQMATQVKILEGGKCRIAGIPWLPPGRVGPFDGTYVVVDNTLVARFALPRGWGNKSAYDYTAYLISPPLRPGADANVGFMIGVYVDPKVEITPLYLAGSYECPLFTYWSREPIKPPKVPVEEFEFEKEGK